MKQLIIIFQTIQIPSIVMTSFINSHLTRKYILFNLRRSTYIPRMRNGTFINAMFESFFISKYLYLFWLYIHWFISFSCSHAFISLFSLFLTQKWKIFYFGCMSAFLGSLSHQNRFRVKHFHIFFVVNGEKWGTDWLGIMGWDSGYLMNANNHESVTKVAGLAQSHS